MRGWRYPMASNGWSSAARCALPAEALLARYAGAGGYADCYTAQIARPVSHAEFVEAFYTAGRKVRSSAQVGISPVGIWRPHVPETSEAGLDSFDHFFADSKLWL